MTIADYDQLLQFLAIAFLFSAFFHGINTGKKK